MERILSDPMKMLGIDLDVRNAAIGGIPSFPYGWCLKNFLGSGAYCSVLRIEVSYGKLLQVAFHDGILILILILCLHIFYVLF